MRNYRSERGGVSVGLLVAIALIVFVGYEAKQFGPLLVSQFAFKDAVVESAKFSSMKSPEQVQNEVVQKAAELSLPVSRDQVKVTRQSNNVRIQVRYELSTDWLPGKPYKWTVEVDEASVLF